MALNNMDGQTIRTAFSVNVGTALRNRVAMPANTAAAGNVGDYAVDGDKLAIYVATVGWVFWTGFQVP